MQKEKKRLFSASENMKQEYCAEIVRIGEMKPIEGSDFLVQTIVDGFSIVVSKGEFTEGEPVIYCMNETALNKDFLSVNNQFEIGERNLNENAAEVNAIMDEYNEKYKNHADELRIKANQLKGSIEGMEKAIVKAKRTISKIEKESASYTGEAKEKADADIKELQEKIERLTESGKKKSEERAKLKTEIEQLVNDGKHIVDEAKKHVGFFNKYGRVKLIELRGCPSYGCIFKKETLTKWNRNVAEENLEDYLTVDENGYEHPFMFDMVGNKLFAEAYVPPMPEKRTTHREKYRNKKLKQVKRVIEGEFSFHPDTLQLKSNMWKFKPDTQVTISVKGHGCVEENSIIETLEYGKLTIGEIVTKKLECHIKAFDIETENVVYVPIDNYYFIPNDGEWYEIETEDGTILKITGNNPVWLPEINAYRRVDELVEGNMVLIDKNN